jgi:menaquinone-dependent protoporphyrinogen oxidase
MRVLVTAASRHDATREIADAIAARLVNLGIDTVVQPIDLVASLDGYDAAVIGSAVYMGRWLQSAHDLITANATVLSSMPVWLFSSGPVGPEGHELPTYDAVDIPEMLTLSGAREHRTFAGRLDRHRLSRLERAATAFVHAPNGDCRDWTAIDDFADEIAASLQPLPPADEVGEKSDESKSPERSGQACVPDDRHRSAPLSEVSAT